MLVEAQGSSGDGGGRAHVAPRSLVAERMVLAKEMVLVIITRTTTMALVTIMIMS